MIIFVVGSARSGTTLMAQVLGRHSQVFTFRELHFFEELWVPEDRGRVLATGQDLRLAARLMKNQEVGHHVPGNPHAFYPQAADFLKSQPTGMDAVQLYAAYLRYLTERNQKQIPLTHTPRDLFYVGEILDLFEEARVLWMVRDPRAVLCSQKLRWRRPLWREVSPSWVEALRAWLNYHPITYSLLWRSAYRASAQHANHQAVRRVAFERFVRDPIGELQSILAWLGLANEDGLLEVGHMGSSHFPNRPDQIGIDPKVLTRWRTSCLTSTEMAICHYLARPEMMDAGYAPEPVRINPFLLVYYLATWFPRIGAALLLNLKRTRSQRLALRRRLAAQRAASP